MAPGLSQKSSKIAALIESSRGGRFDPHYLAYFECFNRQLFFEAHEVLEQLWLAQRGQPKDLFYKGLIQLAGAFVHLQKQRPKPAVALFNLAAGNLGGYPAVYEQLDLHRIQGLIGGWIEVLTRHDGMEEFGRKPSWPTLSINSANG